jgi:two-component system KDP operon response regulator KdpE
MNGTESQVCAECYDMTMSFLINSGVPATSVEVRPLSEEADERKVDEGAKAAAPAPATVGRRACILLIEDDSYVAAALTAVLSRHRYAVIQERSGSAGLHAAYTQRPDLVLLDLGLPDMDGYEILTRLRAVSDVPVIVVTARSDGRSRLHGLNLGADDYVVKPYETAELLARMARVLHRRRSPEHWAEHIYDDGLLRLDSQSFEASVAEVPLKLTPTEFRVLDLLVRNTGVVQPFRKLLARAWDDPNGRDTDKVKFTISRLRGKLDSTALGSASIVSARGIGYLYRTPGPSTTDHPATPDFPSSRTGYGHAGNVLRILESQDPDSNSSETVLRLGPMHIDLLTQQVRVDGSGIELTRKQFDLLALLAQRPGVVIPREQIISEIWPANWEGTGRTLEVHIASLRAKLRMPALIETVRGVGYRLVAPAA